jgi:hypothetical protein
MLGSGSLPIPTCEVEARENAAARGAAALSAFVATMIGSSQLKRFIDTLGEVRT